MSENSLARTIDVDERHEQYSDILARVAALTNWGACHISGEGEADDPYAMEFGIDLDPEITGAYGFESYDGWLTVTYETATPVPGWYAVRIGSSDAPKCPSGAHQPFAPADASPDEVAQWIARLWCGEHTRDGCLIPEAFREITARDTLLALLQDQDPNGAWSVEERETIADITDEDLHECLAYVLDIPKAAAR